MGQDANKSYPGILKTKIHSSRLPADVIFRPRLITRLNKLTNLPVVLITSPAGYGKSSLVSLWSARVKQNCAWFSLDAQDGRVDRFWSYFVASLDLAQVEIDDLFEQAKNLIDPEALCSFVDLLMEKVRSFSEEIVVILEDYHQLAEEAPVHNSISYMISHLPDNLHIVITSRSFPKIGLQKYLVNGTLGIIEEEELSFTLMEVEDFFFKSSHPLSKQEAQEILDFTKGWPVAVKLASLTHVSPHQMATRAKNFKTGRMINDYLFEEVINNLPERIRTFLAITACVDSFSASLAAKLLREDMSTVKQCLTYLQDNNLFITETEGADGELWYRYHALFVDAALDRFQTGDAGFIVEVRERASVWYEEHNMLDESVQAAALAKKYESIQDLIYRNWDSFYQSDDLIRLMRWYEYLPEPYILNHPMLCAVEALPLAVTGNAQLAIERMKHAEIALKGDRDAVYGIIMALKGIAYSIVELTEEANAAAEEAIIHLPDKKEYLRGMSYQILGGTKILSEPEKAIDLFEEALEMAVTKNNELLLCSAFSNLSVLEASLGDFKRGIKWSHQALEPYKPSSHPSHPMLVYAYQAKSFITYKQGNTTQSKEYVDYAITHASENWNPVYVAQCYAIEACINLMRGLSDESTSRVQASISISPYGFASAYPPLVALCAWVKSGSLEIELFKTFEENSSFDPFTWIVQAINFVSGKPVDVEGLIKRLDELPSQRVMSRIYFNLLIALAEESNGHTDKAIAYLIDAIHQAHAIGARQIFVDDAEYISDLMRKTTKTYSDEAVSNMYRLLPARNLNRQTGVGYKDLTIREKEVISLAASGLSTQEIGERLFISTTTAKKHLANVYTKIGVHSRTQAISRLREEGILLLEHNK